MQPTYLLTILRRNWWLILLTTLVGLVAALLPLSFKAPVYRSTAKLIVVPSKALEVNREVLDSLNPNNMRAIVSTLAEILGSSQIAVQAGTQLKLSDSSLAGLHRSTVLIPDSAVVQFVVESGDPQQAAAFANTAGQLALDYATSNYRVYDFAFLDRAAVPSAPLPTPWLRNVLLALVLGAGCGVLLAILREQLTVRRTGARSARRESAA